MTQIPITMDWRNIEGSIGEIQNQGEDYSLSWVFIVTNLIESLHFIKTSNIVTLSKQELIDNIKDPINVNKSFIEGLNYIKKGLQFEITYPYTSIKSSPKINSSANVIKINSYYSLFDNSPTNIKSLINSSPIIAKIPLYNDIFDYNEGIYISNCDSGIVASEYYVLIIGYDVDYIILKCSLGLSFAINGYVLLSTKSTNIIKSIWVVK
jgi:cathepsin L